MFVCLYSPSVTRGNFQWGHTHVLRLSWKSSDPPMQLPVGCAIWVSHMPFTDAFAFHLSVIQIKYSLQQNQLTRSLHDSPKSMILGKLERHNRPVFTKNAVVGALLIIFAGKVTLGCISVICFGGWLCNAFFLAVDKLKRLCDLLCPFCLYSYKWECWCVILIGWLEILVIT